MNSFTDQAAPFVLAKAPPRLKLLSAPDSTSPWTERQRFQLGKESELRLRAGAKTRTIHVDYLARVEGKALYVKTRGDFVEDVKLRILNHRAF